MQVALAISEHPLLVVVVSAVIALIALAQVIAIVLNALARATAKWIHTSTTIRCDRAEDQWLQEMGVSVRERRKRAIDSLDRDIDHR